MIFHTLGYIAEKFNDYKILWGVGASIVLNHYGLVNKPNDIDILIAEKDIKKVDEILCSLGNKELKQEVDTYSTKFFGEYIVDGVEIDVMARFIINHNCGKYEFEFDTQSITLTKFDNNIKIPLTSLEDWYVIYQLMPGREYKVKMIEDYFLANGVENLNLIKRALRKELPDKVITRINKFIEE